ncbi:hypothetical protein CALCODRAFT_318894 [Calocera cornea HHB12733]|uniref:Uncharacterized protein n=1 Tax=Calocera cornea HHB12733 TaxID=1353952 RepID=A0A165F770_9BASI|nr:hypothetical protein CALCODRAFT_318894 [Calocera cornea HHB12733]
MAPVCAGGDQGRGQQWASRVDALGRGGSSGGAKVRSLARRRGHRCQPSHPARVRQHHDTSLQRTAPRPRVSPPSPSPPLKPSPPAIAPIIRHASPRKDDLQVRAPRMDNDNPTPSTLLRTLLNQVETSTGQSADDSFEFRAPRSPTCWPPNHHPRRAPFASRICWCLSAVQACALVPPSAPLPGSAFAPALPMARRRTSPVRALSSPIPNSHFRGHVASSAGGSCCSPRCCVYARLRAQPCFRHPCGR